MNWEALIWVWIHMGMAAAFISICILIWAIFYENKE